MGNAVLSFLACIVRESPEAMEMVAEFQPTTVLNNKLLSMRRGLMYAVGLASALASSTFFTEVWMKQ